MLLQTPENKNLKITEKVVDRVYPCGQFDDKDHFHGYGFIIHYSGFTSQGLFEHGVIDESYERLLLDQNEKCYRYVSAAKGKAH